MLGLGETITSLTESTTEAKYCNIFFDDSRKDALADADWWFASIEVALALTGTAPDRWDFCYAYPTDCLKDREIVRLSLDQDPIDYELGMSSDKSTRLIYTNEEDAKLRYTTDVTNPALFSQNFVMAFAARMAMNLAMPLTREEKNLIDAAKLYQGFLDKAETANANAGSHRKNRDADWISVRG